MTLLAYVSGQVEGLIERVEEAARRAGTDGSPASIHGLRVSLRKLAEGLRVFKDLFPRGAAKSVRKELRAGMKLAGEARNLDIARDLRKRAKAGAEAGWAARREQAYGDLARVLKQWNEGRATEHWRERLLG